ncbi:MAG: protein kinase, partial [Phycisphaerales bacterium]
MTSEVDRLRRAHCAFHDLVELDANEQAARLQRIRSEDPSLGRMLEQLLGAGELDDRTVIDRVHQVSGAARGTKPGYEGRRIGPYEVLDLVGEGAFGTVYRAIRRRPFEQEVAIKVLNGGGGGPGAVARFEQERQMLARMEHPGIAKVFDAGTTEEGAPFVVMEFLRGRPITSWSQEDGVEPRVLLGVFALTCDAVQHAQQKGVLH